MEMDFTYGTYRRLIDSILAGDYETLTVREYLSRDDLPERFLVMRHDVDRKPGNALDFARLEAEAGVRTSYYFRAIEKTFKPDILTAIEELGHEVGYHYEDLDRADGDVNAAVPLFETTLERFRQYVQVDTVSMHGNPLTTYDNRDIWESASFEDYDLEGEVYLSVDFSGVVYFSDTNRTWYDEKTIVNDWPVGPSKKPVQVTSTSELIELIETRQLPKLYLLTLPNRWADTKAEWVVERSKDTAINAGKWGLWAVRSIRGRGPRRGAARGS